MKRVVYKYKIEETLFTIEVPKNSEVLTVQIQSNEPHVWVLQPTESDETAYVEFKILFTGHEVELENDFTFLNTLQYHNGDLIAHVFYRIL